MMRVAGRLRRMGRCWIAALACLAIVTSLAPAFGGAVHGASQTVVSLTFDDGRATAYNARLDLAARGMHGTFYVNSPLLGSSGDFYMTWDQVQNLDADGNEIGGHDAYHADLTAVDPAEAQRQICYDRSNLLGHGIAATDFAYPYGDYSPAVEALVQTCGYISARTTAMATSYAETIPPANPFEIHLGVEVPTLASVEAAVLAAEENGGGWLPIAFHDICDGCSSVSIGRAEFDAILDFLSQQAGNGVVVQTVHDVIGGTLQPAAAGPAIPAAPNGTNGLRNASLELDTNADRAPDCWQFDSYGINNYTWTQTSDAHSGAYAEKVAVSNFASGDSKLMVLEDLGSCTPTVVPGHKYLMTTWYKSDTPVTFTVFARDDHWSFSYWTSSPDFAPASGWTQASWVSPEIPDGINGLSFGLTVTGNGSLTVDDATFDDAAATGPPDTTRPTVVMSAPANGSNLSGLVSLGASASDNVAVDHVDFLVDGSVVGSQVSSPALLAWDSRKVPNGNHTFAARAVDTSGNSTISGSITAYVANQYTNLLQNASLETATGGIPNCWLLGGYGTNTYAWTRTGTAHTGSFGEALTITSYTSGDRKLVTAQDSGTCAPAGAIGHSYTITAWYKGTASPYIYAYYRTSSGAWVYWTQSAALAASSTWLQGRFTTPVLPAGATNISVGMGISGVGSITMDDFGVFLTG